MQGRTTPKIPVVSTRTCNLEWPRWLDFGQSVGEKRTVQLESERDWECSLQLTVDYHMHVKELYEARKRPRKDSSDVACSHMARNSLCCQSKIERSPVT